MKESLCKYVPANLYRGCCENGGKKKEKKKKKARRKRITVNRAIPWLVEPGSFHNMQESVLRGKEIYARCRLNEMEGCAYVIVLQRFSFVSPPFFYSFSNLILYSRGRAEIHPGPLCRVSPFSSLSLSLSLPALTNTFHRFHQCFHHRNRRSP